MYARGKREAFGKHDTPSILPRMPSIDTGNGGLKGKEHAWWWGGNAKLLN